MRDRNLKEMAAQLNRPIPRWVLHQREKEAVEVYQKSHYLGLSTGVEAEAARLTQRPQFSDEERDSDDESATFAEDDSTAALRLHKASLRRDEAERRVQLQQQEASLRGQKMHGVAHRAWPTAFGNGLKPALKCFQGGNETCRIHVLILVTEYALEPFVLPLLACFPRGRS